MKRLYIKQPKTLVRKGAPLSDQHTTRVCQYNGAPGWMFLSHDEEGVAVALFVDSQERVHPINGLVLDERLFSDSIFRAVRVAPERYIVCDIWVLNGESVHEKLCFAARKEKLQRLLELFHSPDLCALTLVEDVEGGVPIRGHEYYDSAPGSVGVFLPAVE